MAQGPRSDEVGAGFISVKLAKALSSPWRSRVLTELNVRPMSPSQFAAEIGGELTTIARAFRQLADWDYIEVVEEKSGGRRRGGVEHIYRSTQRVHLDTPSWKELPRLLRSELSNNALVTYFGRVTDALRAGTFDAEPDRHFSWDAVSLDRQAWKQITDRLDEVLAWLPELETESAQRMRESGEAPIPATVGLAAFRSPTESELKGPRSRKTGSE